MRLFVRTAFWLGVTIYYLPSPAEHLTPGALPNGIERRSAEQSGAARRHFSLRGYKRSGKCRQILTRGAEGGLSQDTLTTSDLVIPWRGPATFNESPICNAVARK